MVGARGDPLGAGLEDLHGAGVRVAALALVHDRAHAVARDRAGDEHDVAAVAQPRDALAAEGERVDAQLELVAPLRARQGAAEAASETPDSPGASEHGRAILGVGDHAWIEGHADDGEPSAGATRSSSRAFCAWRRFSAWSQMRWREP